MTESRETGCQGSAPAPAQPRGQRLGGRAGLLASVLLAAGLLVGCGSGSPSVLDPRGPGADRIATLWWIMFALGVAVFAAVIAGLVGALVRARRAPPEPPHDPPVDATGAVAVFGIAIPAVVLLVVFAATLWTTTRLADGEPAALTIEVVGHQYWWEVRYPEQGIVTANEINIPVGQPVEILVTPNDVIHSFWVPQLHGKIDMIPGKTNSIRLQADAPGEFRGICAEFCGLAHAHMQFIVVAQPADAFPSWIAAEQAEAEPPANDIVARGEQLFLSSACVYCHAVRGTSAASDFGPDLTHLASRRTLAAGILENNRANLMAWIVDPQSIKPGNKMPGVDLSSEDLQSLVTYLQSLE